MINPSDEYNGQAISELTLFLFLTCKAVYKINVILILLLIKTEWMLKL